jgi:CBS domain-containing protein
VVDENECLVGIVSETDVVRGRFPRDPRSRIIGGNEPASASAGATVGEVMSADVVSVGPTGDVVDLVAVMLEHGVRGIPVVDGTRVVGIVTRRDLPIRPMPADKAVCEAVAAFLKHRPTHIPGRLIRTMTRLLPRTRSVKLNGRLLGQAARALAERDLASVEQRS